MIHSLHKRILFIVVDSWQYYIASLISRTLLSRFGKADTFIFDISHLVQKSKGFYKRFPLLIVCPALTHIAKKLIEKIQPKVVIVFNDGGFLTPFIACAKLKNKKTILVQHGIFQPLARKDISYIFRWRKYFFWRLIAKFFFSRPMLKILIFLGVTLRTIQWGLGCCDLILVWGRRYAEYLLDWGLPKSKVLQIGAPMLGNSKPSFEFERKIPLNVVFLGEALVADGYWTREQFKKYFTNIYRSCRVDGINFCIRPHPREDTIFYLELLKEVGISDNVTILPDNLFSMEEVAEMCDIAITINSTAAIYFINRMKPVITIGFVPIPNNYRSQYVDLVTHVGSFKQLKKLLTAIKNGDRSILEQMRNDYRLFFDNHICCVGDKSRLKIAKIITTLVDYN
jgi:hypothetical protein